MRKQNFYAHSFEKKLHLKNSTQEPINFLNYILNLSYFLNTFEVQIINITEPKIFLKTYNKMNKCLNF